MEVESLRDSLHKLVKLFCGDRGHATLYGTMKAEEGDNVVNIAVDFCVHCNVGTLVIKSCDFLICISIIDIKPMHHTLTEAEKIGAEAALIWSLIAFFLTTEEIESPSLSRSSRFGNPSSGS